MSEKSLKRLQPIRHLAEDREQQSAKRFAESQRRLNEAESKLRELRNYLHDYQMKGGLPDPRLLENRFAFLARLREAERYQTQAVQNARGASEQERQLWLNRRREVQVLDKLGDVYQARARRTEAQRDQKQMDEFALRQRMRETVGSNS